jgi:uncharacterized protein (TIGR00251 family)
MRYTVHVKTNAPKTQIVFQSDDTLHVTLKQAPQNNKANLALIRLLSKHFGKPIRIISGHTTKRKMIEVMDN